MKITKRALACFIATSIAISTSSNATAFIPTVRRTTFHPTETHLNLNGDDTDQGVTRRNALIKGTSVPFSLLSSTQPASASSPSKPIADLPMRRLRLPKNSFGREYVIIQLTVQGKGPFDFMVDSGLTTEMITPHLQKELGIRAGGVVQGLSAGGSQSEALVELKDVTLCCGEFREGKQLPLPELHAVVTDFPQEHIDPAHDPVEGMLGMEMLSLFDVDFDFSSGRLRLWAPGSAAAEAAKGGLVTIPAAVLNETGLLGIRVTSAKTPGGQPIVGIIDCGSAFSAVNWAAAPFLGLPQRGDERAYKNSPSIIALGIDGKPLQLPIKNLQFTYTGDASKDSSGRLQFAQPPDSWKPWGPVQVAIGDVPIFSELLGDGVTPFKGPAALIGLDVLSQRRVILETGSKGRVRRLFVSPS